MPSIYEVQIGQKLSFDVYPVSVLGNAFDNVLLEGIISARAAMQYGFDIVALHANIAPSLPDPKPADAFQYNYIRIQLVSGEFNVLGIPWINQSTIEIQGGGKFTLTFDDTSPQDRDRIVLALSSNGFKPSSTRVD